MQLYFLGALMITIHPIPRKVIRWGELCATHPPFSIALDGYVFGQPRYLEPLQGGPKANFNHHEEVDRLGTRCTTAQVYMAIKNGLFSTFRKDGQPHAELYVNDPDQDVGGSTWLFLNHERIKDTKSEPLINKLINLLDFLDVTGGCFPLDPDSSTMRQYNWIFEPYTEARKLGRLPSMTSVEMRNILDAVHSRISHYTLGRAQEIPSETGYEVLGGNHRWKIVQEKGTQTRMQLMKDGITAFASLLGQRQDGNWTYTLCRQSVFIPFPLLQLYEHLNTLEGITDSVLGWGGGDTIGGSPREAGSKLNPQKLEEAITQFLRETNRL